LNCPVGLFAQCVYPSFVSIGFRLTDRSNRFGLPFGFLDLGSSFEFGDVYPLLGGDDLVLDFGQGGSAD
jgi:hypothetical protein